MVNEILKNEFLTFIASFHGGKRGILNLGYELIYDDEIANRILNHYLPTANTRPDKIKKQCLEIMKESCKEEHGNLVDWQGALENLIIFCLLPTESYHEIEDTQPQPCDLTAKAISSVIRFSRWYHTENNFWIRFEPYAQEIGKLLLWDDMEILNRYNP